MTTLLYANLIVGAVGALIQVFAAVQARRVYTNVYWWIGIGALGFSVMVLGIVGAAGAWIGGVLS